MKLSRIQQDVARLAIVLMAPSAGCIALAAEGGTSTWRCGNTYTDQPCKGGKAVDLEDARDTTQRREADAATRDAHGAGDRMERERVRQESASARRNAIVMEDKREPAARPETQASARKNKKGKKEADYFSAHDPVATAKKKEEKAAKSGKRAAAKS
jgi:hypothetical protein